MSSDPEGSSPQSSEVSQNPANISNESPTGQGVTRRNFLRRGARIAGGALVAVGGAGLLARLNGIGQPTAAENGTAVATNTPETSSPLSAEKLAQVEWMQRTVDSSLNLDKMPRLDSYLSSLKNYNDAELQNHLTVRQNKRGGQPAPYTTSYVPNENSTDLKDDVQILVVKDNREYDIPTNPQSDYFAGRKAAVHLMVNPQTGEVINSLAKRVKDPQDDEAIMKEIASNKITDVNILRTLASKLVKGNHRWRTSGDESADFGMLPVVYALDIDGDNRTETTLKGDGEIYIEVYDKDTREQAIQAGRAIPMYHPNYPEQNNMGYPTMEPEDSP